MRPLVIVFQQPAAGNLPGLVQAVEEVQVQHLIPVGPVETLDIGVLIGLSPLDVPDDDAVVPAPSLKVVAQKFRAVVHPDGFGATTLRL